MIMQCGRAAFRNSNSYLIRWLINLSIRTVWSRFVLQVGTLCLLVLYLLGCKHAGSGADRDFDLPNIVYILADDAGYADVSSYGQKRFATPQIDRIAAEGIRFTQHYSGSTVCAPSRSVLMTGQHTGHTFVRGNKGVPGQGDWPIPDSVVTLAEILQDAGYITGAFGKWGLGWTDTEGDPLRQGFDHFFGYLSQTRAHRYYPTYLWDDGRKLELPDNADGSMGTYSHDLIHERALAFIEENRDRPFFLYVPYTLPHVELIVPEDPVLARFRETIPDPKPFEGADYDEQPFREGGYASQPTPRAAFAAMMVRLDRSVGEILDKLEELDLDDNTIVMFSSDNGPTDAGGADPDFFDGNGPLRGVKRDLYEGGIRVPFAVRWPGRIAAGRETDHVSAFWDVLPTLADIAGVSPPHHIDGISFLPTLLGGAGQSEHEYLYWEFHERGGKQAVRKGDWKAVRLNVANDPNAPVELYNLREDPAEEHDVAAAHPDIVRKLRDIMTSARTRSEVYPSLNTVAAAP